MPLLDPDAEASHVSVSAVPGAVFLRLRRDADGRAVRRMFAELTPEQAVSLRAQLDRCIAESAITA